MGAAAAVAAKYEAELDLPADGSDLTDDAKAFQEVIRLRAQLKRAAEEAVAAEEIGTGEEAQGAASKLQAITRGKNDRAKAAAVAEEKKGATATLGKMARGRAARKEVEELRGQYTEERRAERKARLGKVFKQFDTDDSGALTITELKRALMSLPRPPPIEGAPPPKKVSMQDLFDSMDENGDGEITLDEFVNFMPEVLARSVDVGINKSGLVDKFCDDGRDRKLNKIWLQFDIDDSGTVTKEELKRCMCIIEGDSWSEGGLDELMTKFNTEADGVITMNEFLFNIPKELEEKLVAMAGAEGWSTKLADDGAQRKMGPYFKKYDEDSDGKLTLEEFTKACADLPHTKGVKPIEGEMVTEAFKALLRGCVCGDERAAESFTRAQAHRATLPRAHT